METRVIKLADIKPAPYNPRVQLTTKDQEYKALDASIEENGLVLPLIVNIRDNCLIGGHQRLSVLLAAGETETNAVVVDKFDMISGTNGLAGAADGAFLLQKEKRTDGNAVLDVAGRDQQDQRFYLTKDKERLIWTLERTETEAWTEPPDPVLEAIAALVTAEKPTWGGTATELVAALQTDMKPNALAMRLNVRAGKLLIDYHIRYENSRSHAGRSISLTLEPSQA